MHSGQTGSRRRDSTLRDVTQMSAISAKKYAFSILPVGSTLMQAVVDSLSDLGLYA
jgi:hypothetical protein